MIKHVVMWKFKEFATLEEKLENIKKFEDGLMALVGVVPELKNAEFQYNVNPSDRNSDAMLISDFDTMEDLQAYTVHPEHVKVASFCHTIAISRAAVDYEY